MLSYQLTAQSTAKQVAAIRTTLPVKLDGDLTDEAWKKSTFITDLVEMRPSFGQAEDKRNRTELYILYDNNAIYFGGILHEANRDSISTELAGQDAVR